jgi:hypothetical protein
VMAEAGIAAIFLEPGSVASISPGSAGGEASGCGLR